MDEFKLTRKRFQTELEATLAARDLELLFPFRDTLLKTFTDEFIPFVELEQMWETWIKQVVPVPPVEWRKIRVFVLQARYGNALMRQQKSALPHTPEPKRQRSRDSIADTGRDAIVIRASDEEEEEDEAALRLSRTPVGHRIVSRKSSHSPGHSGHSPAQASTHSSGSGDGGSGDGESGNGGSRPLSVLRKPFIHTSAGEAEDKTEFRPPTPGSDQLELTTEIGESGLLRKIVIRKCCCGFQLGTANYCSCESMNGRYLVPGTVIRSRQAKLDGNLLMKVTELLVQWRPFSSGQEWPSSWIPVEPLATWRSACLTDYLLSRVAFPPAATARNL